MKITRNTIFNHGDMIFHSYVIYGRYTDVFSSKCHVIGDPSVQYVCIPAIYSSNRRTSENHFYGPRTSSHKKCVWMEIYRNIPAGSNYDRKFWGYEISPRWSCSELNTYLGWTLSASQYLTTSQLTWHPNRGRFPQTRSTYQNSQRNCLYSGERLNFALRGTQCRV